MKAFASAVPALPQLDLFSVKVVTLVTVLVVSLLTLLASRIDRPVPGMRRFALGLLLICAGSVAGISRLVVPGRAIFILANIGTIAGIINITQGIRQFREFPQLRRIDMAVISVVVAIPFLYWLFVNDDFGMRVGIISLATALLALDAMASMFRQIPAANRMTYWLPALAFGFTAAFLGVRAFAAFTGHYGSNFLAPAPIDIPLSLCADVAFVGCAFGMLLVSNAQMRSAAEKMAFFDPLTNLPNRRMLADRLLEAELRALESGWQVGVIYLDLDGFKLINDTLGHEAGDQILKNVSAAMLPMLGERDCLARVGGDEFVVAVEDLRGRSELETLAENLKAAVEREPVPGGGRETIQVSCGIAVFPYDGESAHDVMREADTAMYRAKRRRRGVVHTAAFR